MALNCLGHIALETGDYTTLHVLCEEAVSLLREETDPWCLAEALHLAAYDAYFQGHYDRARRLGEESVSLYREVGEPLTLIRALHTLGLFAYAQGSYTQAYEFYGKSLHIAKMSKRIHTSSVVATCLMGLGAIVAVQRQFHQAAILLGAAEALYDAADGKTFAGMVDWLTTILRTQLDYDQIVKTVEAQLGECTFTEAWNTGRSVTIEELLAASDPLPHIALRPLIAPRATEDQMGTVASSLVPLEALVGQSSSSLSLTPREYEVLQLLTQGLTSAQIAKELIITPLTVNSHVRSIYNKLGVTSRSAATRYAIEHQLA